MFQDTIFMNKEELKIGNYVDYEATTHIIRMLGDKGCSSNWIGSPDEEYYEHPYDQLKPIKATEENLIELGFKKVPHFTITNSLTFDLGRGRILCVGDVENANCMMYICETDENGRYTDLVNVWNFDFDGMLYLHKVQNLIELLNYTGKYRKDYEGRQG